jgi:hypothetical protein
MEETSFRSAEELSILTALSVGGALVKIACAAHRTRKIEVVFCRFYTKPAKVEFNRV